METQFHCGSILEDIYYGYNMNSNNVFPDEENAPRTRTRKVTLTEITDEFNDVLDSDIPEEINANDSFQALDEGIKEWKSRLEQVVTDGLKKLKKNLKEKKLMVKYIPGVNCGKDELGILNEAKLQAIRGCELDNGKIMRDIQRRVDRIFQVANPKSHFIERMDNNNINQHKKKLININCAAGGGLDNFKELLKSIGSLTESSPWTLKNNTIPIYSPNCDLKDKYALVTRGCTDVLPAYNRWFFNDIIMNPIIQSQKKMISYQEPPKKSMRSCLNINEEFKIQHFITTQSSALKKRISRPKAKQTKQKLNKRYELREFVTKNGVTKIFISKRNERQRSFNNVEDVYSDWVKLMEKPHEDIVIPPPSPKTLLNGPFLYSEILKRNLIIPPEAPEDIYESWRDGIYAEAVDSDQKKLQRGNEPEDYFHCWRHNFNYYLMGYESKPFIVENIFKSWRRNLFEPRNALNSHNSMSENYFWDWLNNFQVKEPSKFNRKNSKRQSRRKRTIRKDIIDQEILDAI